MRKPTRSLLWLGIVMACAIGAGAFAQEEILQRSGRNSDDRQELFVALPGAPPPFSNGVEVVVGTARCSPSGSGIFLRLELEATSGIVAPGFEVAQILSVQGDANEACEAWLAEIQALDCTTGPPFSQMQSAVINVVCQDSRNEIINLIGELSRITISPGL